MSTTPHPDTSLMCRAELHVTRIPWASGRRTTVREPLTLFCDEWASHVHEGTPHRCRETGERWYQRFGDAVQDVPVRGGDVHG